MRVGIDLGGTKIEAAALNDQGEILLRQRIQTPGNDYGAVVQAVVSLVEQVEAELGAADSVGIGTPGSLSLADGRMKNCNSTCLNGQFLQRDLEQGLGRPLRLANDANCFALSESVDGAAAGSDSVFAVILGTGVGGGLVINGRLVTGANGIGSEWGHNVMPGLGAEFNAQARSCYCGNHNCIETFLSGPGFVATYRQLGDQVTIGHAVDARQVAGLAAQGEPRAEQALMIYQRQLAYALSQVINIVDPDVIVLGGGMSNVMSLYDAVPCYWERWVFSDTVRTRLLPAHYGDSSGVRGAAWLWNEKS